MLLSARVLYPICDCNDFSYALQQTWTAGDTVNVYLQLIDASRNLALHGYQPSGLRYCPVASATLQVQVQNLDTNKVVTRFASQPFAQDPSIWLLNILATDVISGCPDIVLTLVEPTGGSPATKTTTGRVQQALSIVPSTTAAVPQTPGIDYIGE